MTTNSKEEIDPRDALLDPVTVSSGTCSILCPMVAGCEEAKWWRQSYAHVLGEMICAYNTAGFAIAAIVDGVDLFAGGEHRCDGTREVEFMKLEYHCTRTETPGSTAHDDHADQEAPNQTL